MPLDSRHNLMGDYVSDLGKRATTSAFENIMTALRRVGDALKSAAADPEMLRTKTLHLIRTARYEIGDLDKSQKVVVNDVVARVLDAHLALRKPNESELSSISERNGGASVAADMMSIVFNAYVPLKPELGEDLAHVIICTLWKRAKDTAVYYNRELSRASRYAPGPFKRLVGGADMDWNDLMESKLRNDREMLFDANYVHDLKSRNLMRVHDDDMKQLDRLREETLAEVSKMKKKMRVE